MTISADPLSRLSLHCSVKIENFRHILMSSLSQGSLTGFYSRWSVHSQGSVNWRAQFHSRVPECYWYVPKNFSYLWSLPYISRQNNFKQNKKTYCGPKYRENISPYFFERFVKSMCNVFSFPEVSVTAPISGHPLGPVWKKFQTYNTMLPSCLSVAQMTTQFDVTSSMHFLPQTGIWRLIARNM